MEDVRRKMLKYREDNDLTREVMAFASNCSEGLLRIVEEGGVTIPSIAKRIGEAYHLTELETEELMAENRRPHSPNYDPERFVLPERTTPVIPAGVKPYGGNTRT